MRFRITKFASGLANLMLVYLTWKLIAGELDWGLSFGAAAVSGLWLVLVGLRLRTLFNSYFDVFSRLYVLLPLTLGLVLSAMAMYAAPTTPLLVLSGCELLGLLGIYIAYRRNRSHYVRQGHGPLPENAWISPPSDAIMPGDLILFSGAMAKRLYESVGHGEIALQEPNGRMVAFSSYMEDGARFNDLKEVTSKRLKHGHYIVLRLRNQRFGIETNALALSLAKRMLAQNIAWRDKQNAARRKCIERLWLPAAVRNWLFQRIAATGYDWTGLFSGLRATGRWTCIGACLELYYRLCIETMDYGTGLLGLGTGLFNPIMPIRFLSDPAFRLLTREDEAAWNTCD